MIYSVYMKVLFKFFDVLEDRVRAWLSRRPLLYGMIAGIGAVLYFRSIWYFADEIHLGNTAGLLISLFILLITGSFVAHFVSNEVILSGLKKEKKLIERTETEVASEISTLTDIREELRSIRAEVNKINERMQG